MQSVYTYTVLGDGDVNQFDVTTFPINATVF